MKGKKASIVVALVLLFSLAIAAPGSARMEKVQYSGTECPIQMGPPERVWVSEDGILHVRGVHMVNVLDSSTPYLTGTAYLVLNSETNLVTGEVHGYGTTEIHPDAYEGTWVGRWSTHVSSEGVLEGVATARGTGELEGLIDFNHMSSPEAPDPTCFGMNNIDSGTIFVP